MTTSYDLLQKHAEQNKQIYTLLRFACRCEHASALTMNTYDSAIVFLSSKIPTSRIYNITDISESVTAMFTDLSKDLDFKILKATDEIENTDLLYIDTPAEGNFRASELTRHANKVSKYILLPNTVKNGLTPSPTIKLADDQKPIGLNFGINHFLQTNDNWFILEHDDVDPGMTVLVNRKNVANAYS